eukprot:m.196764 g.196764  ORF g.196764 m.196764 type:complete len:888 (-) comp14910_c0_seq1:1563-4226(-)
MATDLSPTGAGITPASSNWMDKVVHEGFLKKQGNIRHNWKRRYFVLKGDRITYQASKHSMVIHHITLNGASCSLPTHHKTGIMRLAVKSPYQSRIFHLEGPDKDIQEWHTAICSSISQLATIAANSTKLQLPNDSAATSTSDSAATRPLSTLSLAPPTTVVKQRSGSSSEAQERRSTMSQVSTKYTIMHDGYLEKRGLGNTAWKRRYFQLKLGRLEYYTEQDGSAVGQIILSGARIAPRKTVNDMFEFEIASPSQQRVFHLRAPMTEAHDWQAKIQQRVADPKPVTELSIQTQSIDDDDWDYLPPVTTATKAKNTLLGDKLRAIAAGPRLCKMFCKGSKCKYCDHSRYLGQAQAVEGLFSSWITSDILAMSRPTQLAVEQCGLVQTFLDKDIGVIVNLQEHGEHKDCGQGNLSSGFSYSFKPFEENGIHVKVFGWKDFGVPDMASALRMVKSCANYLEAGQNIAVHCHAGLGRTGMLIACILCFTTGITGDEAISYVRVRRPGAIQTSKQVQFVKDFMEYIEPCFILFRSEPGISADVAQAPDDNYTLARIMERQRAINLTSYPVSYSHVPRLLLEVEKVASVKLKAIRTHTDKIVFKQGLFDLAAFQTEVNPLKMSGLKGAINHNDWASMVEQATMSEALLLIFDWQLELKDNLFPSTLLHWTDTLGSKDRTQSTRSAIQARLQEQTAECKVDYAALVGTMVDLVVAALRAAVMNGEEGVIQPEDAIECMALALFLGGCMIGGTAPPTIDAGHVGFFIEVCTSLGCSFPGCSFDLILETAQLLPPRKAADARPQPRGLKREPQSSDTRSGQCVSAYLLTTALLLQSPSIVFGDADTASQSQGQHTPPETLREEESCGPTLIRMAAFDDCDDAASSSSDSDSDSDAE